MHVGIVREKKKAKCPVQQKQMIIPDWDRGQSVWVELDQLGLMWLKAAFVAVKLDRELKPREIENQDPNQPEHQQQNKLTTVSKPSQSDRPIDMFTSE